MWMWIGGALLALNGLAFAAHGVDKWKARRDARRIPERTLLLLAVPFAAPGAWTGMKVFRHKTVKRSFRWKMVGVSVLNVLCAYGLWVLSAKAAGA